MDRISKVEPSPNPNPTAVTGSEPVVNAVQIYDNPPGSGISHTDETVKVVEKFLASRSEVQSSFVAAGGFTGGEPHAAMIFVDMKRKGSRGKSQEKGRELSQLEFIEVVRNFLTKEIPGAKPQVQDP